MSQSRQPKGVPVGGQYAENAHDEAGASLADDIDLDELTFIESGDDLYVLDDGEKRPATADERSHYERTLPPEGDERDEFRRVAALAQFLNVDASDIERSEGDYFGLAFYEADGQEWVVGTEEQAQSAAIAKAKEDVWAFRAQYLADGTGIDERAIRAIQETMYENASEPLQKIVEATWNGGLDGFADDAVDEDGRGHFLSGYDGEEQEITVQVGGQTQRMYLYRYN